jgi:hypothetical protein
MVGFRPSAYTSIKTLPLSEWWLIHETGDITLLLPNNKFKVTKDLFRYCMSAWDSIRQQHLDMFGTPEGYKEYLRLTANIAIAKMQYAMSRNNFDLMLLRLAEDDLEKISSSPTQSNLKTKGNNRYSR